MPTYQTLLPMIGLRRFLMINLFFLGCGVFLSTFFCMYIPIYRHYPTQSSKTAYINHGQMLQYFLRLFATFLAEEM